MKSILLNTFAVIGFGTFIFFACSVADPIEPPQEMNTPCDVDVTLQNQYGKYQITASYESGNSSYIMALNTETGVMKSYRSNGGEWEEAPNHPPITFTH